VVLRAEAVLAASFSQRRQLDTLLLGFKEARHGSAAEASRNTRPITRAENKFRAELYFRRVLALLIGHHGVITAPARNSAPGSFSTCAKVAAVIFIRGC